MHIPGHWLTGYDRGERQNSSEVVPPGKETAVVVALEDIKKANECVG